MSRESYRSEPQAERMTCCHGPSLGNRNRSHTAILQCDIDAVKQESEGAGFNFLHSWNLRCGVASLASMSKLG